MNAARTLARSPRGGAELPTDDEQYMEQTTIYNAITSSS